MKSFVTECMGINWMLCCSLMAQEVKETAVPELICALERVAMQQAGCSVRPVGPVESNDAPEWRRWYARGRCLLFVFGQGGDAAKSITEVGYWDGTDSLWCSYQHARVYAGYGGPQTSRFVPDFVLGWFGGVPLAPLIKRGWQEDKCEFQRLPNGRNRLRFAGLPVAGASSVQDGEHFVVEWHSGCDLLAAIEVWSGDRMLLAQEATEWTTLESGGLTWPRMIKVTRPALVRTPIGTGFATAREAAVTEHYALSWDRDWNCSAEKVVAAALRSPELRWHDAETLVDPAGMGELIEYAANRLLWEAGESSKAPAPSRFLGWNEVTVSATMPAVALPRIRDDITPNLAQRITSKAAASKYCTQAATVVMTRLARGVMPAWRETLRRYPFEIMSIAQCLDMAGDYGVSLHACNVGRAIGSLRQPFLAALGTENGSRTYHMAVCVPGQVDVTVWAMGMGIKRMTWPELRKQNAEGICLIATEDLTGLEGGMTWRTWIAAIAALVCVGGGCMLAGAKNRVRRGVLPAIPVVLLVLCSCSRATEQSGVSVQLGPVAFLDSRNAVVEWAGAGDRQLVVSAYKSTCSCARVLTQLPVSFAPGQKVALECQLLVSALGPVSQQILLECSDGVVRSVVVSARGVPSIAADPQSCVLVGDRPGRFEDAWAILVVAPVSCKAPELVDVATDHDVVLVPGKPQRLLETGSDVRWRVPLSVDATRCAPGMTYFTWTAKVALGDSSVRLIQPAVLVL